MLTHGSAVPVTPSRVVVLGARGFVGGRLSAHFNRLEAPCCPLDKDEVDLTQPTAADQLRHFLEPGDAIVFTSALTPEHGRDRATFLKNVAMADAVCTAIAEIPCSHFIYISSDSVYAPSDAELDESCPCESGDLYALGHIVREKLLLDACGKAGVPLAIVRMTAVYGASDSHNAYGPNRFVRTAVNEGKITLFGQGEEERDHIYVDDVVRLVGLCLAHRSAGIVNAASGVSVSFHEIARTICDAVGHPVALQTAERRMPIVHRRFRVSGREAAFPGFQPTPLDQGIQAILDEMARSSKQAGMP